MSKEDEEILRAILEKGSDSAKKAAAEALSAQPSLPDDPAPVRQAKQKKKVKGFGQVIGKIGKSKFYKDKKGNIVDQNGQPLTGRLADILSQETATKKAAVQKAVAPTETVSQDQKTAERKIGRELGSVVKATSNLARSHEKILTTIPNAFGEVEKVITNLTEQHEKVVSDLIKQNDDLRDKVIESLTGVKTATKAGGAKSKPSKGVGASKAAKAGEIKTAVTKKAAKVAKEKEQKEKIKEPRGPVAGMKKAAKQIGFAALAGAAVGAMLGGENKEAPAGGPGGAAPGGGPAGAGPGAGYAGPGVAATGSAKEAIDFFEKKGFTRAQAIGIAANIEAESNFKTNAVGDSGKAYGLAQWHPDRQAIFQRTYGKPIRESNFQEQLEFINWELNNNEKRAGGMIRQAQDAGQAAAYVDQYYERSSGAHRQKRIDTAMKYAKGEGLAGGPAAATAAAGSTFAVPQASSVPGGPSQFGNFAVPGQGPGGATQNFGEPQKTGSNGNLDQAQLVSVGQGNHKLQPSAAAAYEAMVQAAKQDGVSWSITDSYRSYASQVKVAQEKGLYSQGGLAARPGTSNHGWGTALDLGGGANSKGTKQNDWLMANAGRFGFSTIPREPWHWEYKGAGAAVASAGKPEAAPQRAPANALAAASSQNAVDNMIAENQARGGTIIMQNDKVVNNTRTVYQTASYSPRKMEQGFNPYNLAAGVVAGRGLF
jgi:hypothetical protein